MINLLRESLTRDLFEVTTKYGRSIYRLVRLVLFYSLAGIAIFWCAEALKAAGIEIPFPQRDLHIRSGLPLPEPVRE